MTCKNYHQIMGYLSSSELNRCKKNGLYIWEGRENWMEVLKYPWLTRKLRRKIGHLLQLDLLPIVYKPIMEPYPGFAEEMIRQYLKAEDDFILKGMKL